MMATLASLQTSFAAKMSAVPALGCSLYLPARPAASWNCTQKNNKKRSLTVVAAFGEVSADGTNYLIAGAAAVALIGTAFPILFSRKDLCPECDGAGFIRKSGGGALRANAARKDQAQIVCPNCNGLGKLNQVDK
ncbi:uncharacterized protein LOC8258379 [Ricinus communis]|uniref:uncharacterized protein LOC8258379 n=1 Tax=Ricinus communis TaxID=3988 RepID=UPI00201AE287|nr:uncharacterized protein LOC8258379 [Ricinus communis]